MTRLSTSVTLPKAIATDLLHWAHERPDIECCGLLYGYGGEIFRAVRTENVASDSAMRFEIDPASLIAAEKAARNNGDPIAGYFHSHPNGRFEPSQEDAVLAVPDGRLWLVIAGEKMTLWRAVEGGALHGRFDQIALHIVETESQA